MGISPALRITVRNQSQEANGYGEPAGGRSVPSASCPRRALRSRCTVGSHWCARGRRLSRPTRTHGGFEFDAVTSTSFALGTLNVVADLQAVTW